MCLRKLLEAKDCAVRAAFARHRDVMQFRRSIDETANRVEFVWRSILTERHLAVMLSEADDPKELAESWHVSPGHVCNNPGCPKCPS